VKTTRMLLYWTIAIFTTSIAFYLLAQEPPPGYPINLVHLITKYQCK
jgi:hypothetical protein